MIVIAFNEDKDTNFDRNINDFIQEEPNYDSLQALIPMNFFPYISEQNINNITYDFYVQNDEFIDAISYI